jgi:hypothetical protein
LKRSSLLSVLLLVAVIFVCAKTYQLWREGPWSLPGPPGKTKDVAPLEEPKEMPQSTQLASTKSIVENNLFDPERGAGAGQATSSVAMQRIQRLILVGTVIMGASRYAIFQESSNVPSGAQKAQPTQLRLKLGDVVDGFRLSEIHDKRVVFTSATSKFDIALDFLQKADDVRGPASAPSKSGSAATPSVPRRERLPAPPVTR